MTVSRQSLFLFIWALTPLVSALSAKTAYPNQIYVLYQLANLAVAVVLFRDFITMMRYQAKWLVLIFAYCVAFIVVSMHGVDYATSVEYGVYYLPLVVPLEFSLAFAAGFLCRAQKAFNQMMIVAVLLILYTLVQIQVAPEQTRFISSLNIPMAIPLFMFSGRIWLAVVCTLALLLSLKKTILGVGVASFGLAWLLRKYARPDARRKPFDGRAVVTAIGAMVGLTIAVALLSLRYGSYVTDMMGRFTEAEDASRTSITVYSLLLLAQNFPQGIGWFGFLSLSIGVIPYEITDARGDAHLGANLHNTYMTWALEGGLPVVLVMLVLFWKLASVIRTLMRQEQTRNVGVTLLIWLFGGMVFGAFQQWHSSGSCWMLFGFAFGCYERYKSRPSNW